MGKEYKYDKVIFEGKYFNGERNGKGKEYYNNQLIFEGSYSDGKRNGFGKEYYHKDGNLRFKGEYQNGSKNMGMEKNINMAKKYLKENIWKEKELDKFNSLKQ